MSARLRAALAMGLALSVGVPPAFAAPARETQPGTEPTEAEVEQARRLFEAGSLAYDKARYADAARAFGEAHRLYPRPAIAFSWAQALRRQYFVDANVGHLVRATQLLRSYLAEVPQGRRRADAVALLETLTVLEAAAEPQPRDPTRLLPGAASRPEPEPVTPPARTELIVYSGVAMAEASVDDGAWRPVPYVAETTPGSHTVRVRAPGYQAGQWTPSAVEGRLIAVEAALRPIPARLDLSTRPGARVVLDGRELGHAPLAGVTEVTPGTHELSVTAPGRVDFRQTLEASHAERLSVRAELPPTPERRAAWATLGAAGGLTVAGGVTLGLALSAQRQATRLDPREGTTAAGPDRLDRYNERVRHRDGLRGATIGLWSTALVSAVVGSILVLSDRRGRRGRSSRSARARGAATRERSANRVARSGPTAP